MAVSAEEVALLEDLEKFFGKESITAVGEMDLISASALVALEFARKSGMAGGMDESVWIVSSRDPTPPLEGRRLPDSGKVKDGLRTKDGLRSRSLVLSGGASGSWPPPELVPDLVALLALAMDSDFVCFRPSSLPLPPPLVLLAPHIGVEKKGAELWLWVKLDFCIVLTISITPLYRIPCRNAQYSGLAGRLAP